MDQASMQEESKTWEIARIALELFSQKGFAGTSMWDIARAAGTGKSTLYDYFATKEELFKAATYVWIKAKVTGLRETMAGLEDPMARLEALGDYLEHVASRHKQDMPRMFVEFLQQSLIKGGVLYKHSNDLMEEMLKAPEIIQEVLLEGVARGTFKPEIAPIAGKLAVNFIAFMDGLIFRGCMLNDPIDIREHFTLYLDSLVATCLMPRRLTASS